MRYRASFIFIINELLHMAANLKKIQTFAL
jgi:hypothetical protein